MGNNSNNTRPLAKIMGILNLTPDSFSDGGRFSSTQQAVEYGLQLLENGADILDVGGESTRPGAETIPEHEELKRIIPVIEGLQQHTECRISVDTMKPDVARAAACSGAQIWNDVSALTYAPASLATAAELNMTTVLMHMQGTPGTMQKSPHYADVVTEIIAFLQNRRRQAVAAGIKPEKLIADPGIGFGKTLEHNIRLLRNLPKISRQTQMPILLGASRKRFIHHLHKYAETPDKRLGGSIATAIYAAQHGAQILRVHDVAQTVQALKISQALAPPLPLLP